MQQINLAEAYYNRATANFFLENFRGALADCNQALEINPNSTKTLIARGIVYSALGAIEDAIWDYKTVLKINPNSYYAYFNLGVAYSTIGNQKKAIYAYNIALQINPHKADVYYNRGNCRYALGDKDGTISDYNIALDINPDKADAYYNRGEVLYELADKFHALEDFKKAADIYKHKGQETDYQDALEKIKSLSEPEYINEYRENRVESNLNKNDVNYSFDVLAEHQDIWKESLQDLKSNINKSNWQIVSRKDKKFIRIRFYGTDEECLILSKKVNEYIESYLKNMKSDFDADLNNKVTLEENWIDNTDFDKISDNNYSAQFESDRYDGWLDCGYMNDVINPYEVY